LLEQPRRNVNGSRRIDPEHMAVIGQMMDRAERKTVRHRRFAVDVRVLDDVGSL
jgi:hypothetical protein